MARILDMFNLRRNAYVKADGLNPEGFPSFKRSLEEAYLQVLLTNTLGGTFYATSQKLLGESLALHAEIALADPAFMARAIVYARREGLMRLQPIVGLAFLARADRALFRRAFGEVIHTPGDLADFVEIARGGVAPGRMGRSIKTAVNGWLNTLSEYHAIKYGTGGQGYALRDVLRLTHPRPSTDSRDSIFLWLTDPEKWASSPEKRALTPQIDAFERLKRTDGADQSEARELIDAGRLPYEVVTGAIKPDLATWNVLLRQMPYLALLRHLNTLQRAGVFREAQNVRYAAGRLVDHGMLTRAKILPFQLYMAYQMFTPETGEEQQIANALADALEASFGNLPDLPGAVCIAPDVSGSMSGLIAQQGKTRYIDVAGIFAGALVKSSPTARVLPFENSVVDIKINPRDSLMTTVERLAKIGGGGTAVSAPVSRLLDHKVKVDAFIGITDNIEWATDQSGRHGFLPAWREYRQRVSPHAAAFLVTIAPHRHAVAPAGEPGVHTIYGWNDTVLKYIALTLSGAAGQVEAVRAMDL
jgi:60 kDa SS-A/Ro ribonucleoprotein